MGRFPKKMPAFSLRLRKFGVTMLMAAGGLNFGAAALEASSHGAAAHEPAESATPDHSDAASNGIRLGEFKVRTDYPVEAQKCTVRFVLYASANEKDRDAKRHLAAQHEQKIRDVVIVATRLAPLHVFQEPDLAKFRRRILIRLRRYLPDLAIENVYISDFGLHVRVL